MKTKTILGLGLLAFAGWYFLKDKIGGGAPNPNDTPSGGSSGGGGAYSPELVDVKNPYLVPSTGTAAPFVPGQVIMQPLTLNLGGTPPLTISGI